MTQMKTSLEEKELQDNEMELIEFRIFNRNKNNPEKVQIHIFGINVYKVKEVIFKPDMIYKVPSDIDYLEGMVNLRSKVIPIINLQKKLGYSDDDDLDPDYLVITEFNNVICGFMVHEIKKIRRFNWKDIVSPADEIKSKYGDLITAITLLPGDEILLILDFEKVIADMNTDYFNFHLDDKQVLDLNHAKQILFVDDSKVARKMAKKALEEAGYEVIEAVNGVEAYNVIKDALKEAQEENVPLRSKICSIISDIEMPLMDGFTLAKTIKENPELKVMPIVLHSSLSQGVMAARGKNVGAADFLTKFNASALVEAAHKFSLDT